MQCYGEQVYLKRLFINFLKQTIFAMSLVTGIPPIV
jgi:hypothetical protein